jgi:4-diphosphocytidyl-2-C-methyl-D-erythritol kinase
MRPGLVLRPSAKINLTLHVGGVRPDGFHDVRTVMQSIALADRLTFTPKRGPFALIARSTEMPVDRTNLVYRAAQLLWQSLGRTGNPRDVQVALDKRIPIAAGLGGGSADAAATLVALNVLWRSRRPRHELMQLAAGIGADVPFFLQGGTALGVGRGDELYPLDDIRPFHVVLIKPSVGVSTADAYRWLDDDRRDDTDVTSYPASSSGELDLGWPGGPIAVANDLEASVSARHPLGDIVRALRGAGARAAAMSGSGSAVFGVFDRALSKTALRKLSRPDWLVIPSRTISRREANRRLGL